MKRGKIKRVVVSAVFLVALVAILYLAAKAITEFTTNNSTSVEDFAKCLKDKEVKMYGAYWCGHCQNQKRMFGKGVLEEKGVYIECDSGGENPQEVLCLQKRIEGFPTWEINEKLYPGEQSLNKLAELSGCRI